MATNVLGPLTEEETTEQASLLGQDFLSPLGIFGKQFEEKPAVGGDVSQIPTLSREQAIRKGQAGFGAQLGLGLTQPIGEVSPVSPASLAQIGAATAIGFIGGGPIGGVTALATSGLSAFLNSRAEKRRQRQFGKLRADAEKARREQILRDEKWQRTNRLDNLRTAKFNRSRTIMQDQWKNFQFINEQLLGLINNNATLKERFARTGF